MPGPAPEQRTTRRTRLLVPALAIVTIASLALAAWALLSKPEAPGTSRLTVLLEGYFHDSEEGPLLSPDDRTFLYGNMQSDLVLRREANPELTVVPGTAGSWSPSFSPDGRSIAFTTGFPGDLKVVDLGTSAARTLDRGSALGYGTSWSDDGWIYYTADLGRVIRRVQSEGGKPELVARVDTAESETVLRQPHALPGGKGLLYTRWRNQGPPDVIHLDLASGRDHVVIGGLAAWYVPAGYLVLVRPDGRLSAMRFAPGPGTIEGRAVDLERNVRVAIGGQPIAEVSARGSIVYGPASGSDQLVRVTRTGQPSPVDPQTRGSFRSLALSPDGRRAAVSVQNGGGVEVWIKSLDDGPFSRVGSAGTYAYRMFWSPDGRSVGFISDVDGQPGAFFTAADGTGAVEPLPLAGRSVDEGTWTRDGRWLVVRAGSGSGRDLYAIRVGGDTTPVTLAATEAEEYAPTVSPDGRWLAYGSDGSGQDEIFVRPFGSPGERRYQVSVGGGNEPLWSNSGRELFYRDLSGNLVSAAIAPGDAFQVTARRVLFSTVNYSADVRNRTYAVSPDDQAFYFIQRGSANVGGVVVLRNWLGEVKRELEGAGN
jgi:serine/threonine-protein kinase